MGHANSVSVSAPHFQLHVVLKVLLPSHLIKLAFTRKMSHLFVDEFFH